MGAQFYHRRGVAYNNAEVKNKFNKANINASDRNLDYRGHSGNQVLKPDNKPGVAQATAASSPVATIVPISVARASVPAAGPISVRSRKD